MNTVVGARVRIVMKSASHTFIASYLLNNVCLYINIICVIKAYDYNSPTRFNEHQLTRDLVFYCNNNYNKTTRLFCYIN